MSRIESRPSKTADFNYDFFIDFLAEKEEVVNNLVSELKSAVKSVTMVGSSKTAVPWFPRKMTDLDTFADKVKSYGAELDADHPGFKDEEYRKRRNQITEIAKTYRTGQPIPRIQYTPQELSTW